ncbi:NAD-dependent epimerase/dehydratase family protein [Leifsonia sp. 2TAF2]|uniref:NAD-dependent epimerase/dehydratase family protein n=1 Tax=Leifsonia sp. 2TAF2 TaxID=3233009 RepID=UPI003F9991B2
MKILVTGGSGLIGRFAVDRLVRSGHDVLAVERTASAPHAAGLLRATTEVIGDASDPRLMDSVMPGIDAVVHLAAIPAPLGHTARELLTANSITTMTVLEAAGEHGVKAVVMASSISILGMAWCADLMDPLYLPVDEDHPLRPTEGYALSKECDEAAARMASRRWGLPIVAMRFPFTDTRESIQSRRTDADATTRLAKELWAYLDVRDAARAIELGIGAMIDGAVRGCSVVNVLADDVLLDEPLGELMSLWHPAVPFDADQYGFRGAYDASSARELLGFEAEHLIHPRM